MALHYITLHSHSLHYIALRHNAFHYITLQYIALLTLQYTALHCSTLYYIAYIHACMHTLEYIALRCVAVHYIALRYITLHLISLGSNFHASFIVALSCTSKKQRWGWVGKKLRKKWSFPCLTLVHVDHAAKMAQRQGQLYNHRP